MLKSLSTTSGASDLRFAFSWIRTAMFLVSQIQPSAWLPQQQQLHLLPHATTPCRSWSCRHCCISCQGRSSASDTKYMAMTALGLDSGPGLKYMAWNGNSDGSSGASCQGTEAGAAAVMMGQVARGWLDLGQPSFALLPPITMPTSAQEPKILQQATSRTVPLPTAIYSGLSAHWWARYSGSADWTRPEDHMLDTPILFELRWSMVWPFGNLSQVASLCYEIHGFILFKKISL